MDVQPVEMSFEFIHTRLLPQPPPPEAKPPADIDEYPQTTKEKSQSHWYRPSCQTSALWCLGAPAHQWRHSINQIQGHWYSVNACRHCVPNGRWLLPWRPAATCAARVFPSAHIGGTHHLLDWDVNPDVFLRLQFVWDWKRKAGEMHKKNSHKKDKLTHH